MVPLLGFCGLLRLLLRVGFVLVFFRMLFFGVSVRNPVSFINAPPKVGKEF